MRANVISWPQSVVLLMVNDVEKRRVFAPCLL